MSTARRAKTRSSKSKVVGRRQSAQRKWLSVALAVPVLVALAILALSHFNPKSDSSLLSLSATRTNDVPT